MLRVRIGKRSTVVDQAEGRRSAHSSQLHDLNTSFRWARLEYDICCLFLQPVSNGNVSVAA